MPGPKCPSVRQAAGIPQPSAEEHTKAQVGLQVHCTTQPSVRVPVSLSVTWDTQISGCLCNSSEAPLSVNQDAAFKYAEVKVPFPRQALPALSISDHSPRFSFLNSSQERSSANGFIAAHKIRAVGLYPADMGRTQRVPLGQVLYVGQQRRCKDTCGTITRLKVRLIQRATLPEPA